MIFLASSLIFSASIPVSSEKFSEIISKTLQIEKEYAEKLKKEFGLSYFFSKDQRRPKIKETFDALVPAVIDLIEQVKNYVNYYQTHNENKDLPEKHRKIKEILLCGGGANVKGLKEFFLEKFKIPVFLANPWVNILKSNQKIPLTPEKSLSYTTAIGLAMRGLKE